MKGRKERKKGKKEKEKRGGFSIDRRRLNLSIYLSGRGEERRGEGKRREEKRREER